MEKEKERKTGIDCLRIVAMIMILFIHFYGREALQPEFNLSDGNYYFIILCCSKLLLPYNWIFYNK